MYHQTWWANGGVIQNLPESVELDLSLDDAYVLTLSATAVVSDSADVPTPPWGDFDRWPGWAKLTVNIGSQLPPIANGGAGRRCQVSGSCGKGKKVVKAYIDIETTELGSRISCSYRYRCRHRA